MKLQDIVIFSLLNSIYVGVELAVKGEEVLIRRLSEMRRTGVNLTKSNVISACLGIHIPFRVSSRMLQLAETPIDLTLPGKKGEENGVYDQILHLNWAGDYSDTYDELKVDHYEHLIHQPPI